jgi:hypothetical protein
VFAVLCGVPCCRATWWRFSFEALLLGQLHSPESLRLHTDPFRVTWLFDDHTVTAHGRPRARGKGSCGARDVDSGVADQLACSCRGSVGEIAASYARSVRELCFVCYRCAYFAFPLPFDILAPARHLCLALCYAFCS